MQTRPYLIIKKEMRECCLKFIKRPPIKKKTDFYKNAKLM